MNDLVKIIQWLLSCVGALSFIFSFISHRKLNKQQHELDKIKIQYTYAVQKRNNVISILNKRISDIELWRNVEFRRVTIDKTSDEIDIPTFQKYLQQYEVILIYGRYLLSQELCDSLDELYDMLNRCNEAYQAVEDPTKKPEDIFAEKIFDKEIQTAVDNVKQKLHQAIEK